MEFAGHPAGVAALMARVAVGDRHSGEGLVRNVVYGLAVRRRIRTTVTSRALISNRHLAVVPLRRLPRRDAVAAHTVHRCWNVVGGFPGSRTVVVAR
jgi:hypothetical protein